MKTVATYSTPDEAHLAVARLQSAGIAASVRDDLTVSTMWIYSNAMGGVRVDVPDEELPDAMALLGEKPTGEGLLVCPSCGSTDLHVRPLSALAAILVLLQLPLPLRSRTVDCRACGKSFATREPGRA